MSKKKSTLRKELYIKRLEFNNKFIDCLIKILDDSKEKGQQPTDSEIQATINYREVMYKF